MRADATQTSISATQLILQNMIGKIAGPLYGMGLYSAFGQAGFALGVVAMNVVSTAVAEATMPDHGDIFGALGAPSRWCDCLTSSRAGPGLKKRLWDGDDDSSSAQAAGVDNLRHLRPGVAADGRPVVFDDDFACLNDGDWCCFDGGRPGSAV